VVRAVLWFHPVVWILAARLSREQELACDEAVIAAGHVAHEYAAFLLSNVRALRSVDLVPCAMAGSGAGSVKHRSARLLESRPVRVRKVWLAASLAVTVAFVFATLVVTPVRAQSGKKDDKVYKVADGIAPPKLLKKVEPKYTPEAKDAKIEGSVVLKVVVTTEGKADNIEVVKGLDPGLDQNAMDAVAQWVFQPGTKEGQPVNVSATIEINFHLGTYQADQDRSPHGDGVNLRVIVKGQM